MGKTLGADGLACCGAEHGPGFAFCQTDPDYLCCSGAKWAISCSSKAGCSVDDQGIPACKKSKELQAKDVCPGLTQDCKVIGADGLACCGAEHGAGHAFCQTDPAYTCCSGKDWAISCPAQSDCKGDNTTGVPSCEWHGAELETSSRDVCPGVGQECKTLGADGLACCGAEHGPGFAFCQTDPDYLCCSGAKWAISCSSKAGCSVDDQGIPACKKSAYITV